MALKDLLDQQAQPDQLVHKVLRAQQVLPDRPDRPARLGLWEN